MFSRVVRVPWMSAPRARFFNGGAHTQTNFVRPFSLAIGGAAATTIFASLYLNQPAQLQSLAPTAKPKPNTRKASLHVYDIPIQGKKFPRTLPAFIEVCKGSRNKYEWDNKLGFLRLDRILHSAVFYPHDYGFIPQTLCDDGDPLDVLVISDAPIVPGCIVDVRPICYMVMEDEKGIDEKVLAVLKNDPHTQEIRSMRDVPEHMLREITHFFETYKALEKKKWAKVGGWKGTQDTYDLIERTHVAYKAACAEGSMPYF